MVSLQPLGNPLSNFFFKPAQYRFTRHFPAGMLHQLTLYISYEPQVPREPELSSGNLKSLMPSSALPRRSLRLRQQSHIPVLTCANNTYTHAVTGATKWGNSLFFFFFLFEERTDYQSHITAPLSVGKKEVKDTVITSLNCGTGCAGEPSPLHIRILSTTQLQESCPSHVGTTSPKNQQDAVCGVKLHFILSEWQRHFILACRHLSKRTDIRSSCQKQVKTGGMRDSLLCTSQGKNYSVCLEELFWGMPKEIGKQNNCWTKDTITTTRKMC